ncbi:MAG: PRD domain-containing protein [Anaerocolumna sp.]
MDLMERVRILKEYNMMNEVAYKDILFIIKMVEEEYHITLTEENAGIMITHICAAFRRNELGEEIDPLHRSVFEEIKESKDYQKAEQIIESMIAGIENQLSQNEREYFLIHICNLLAQSERI